MEYVAVGEAAKRVGGRAPDITALFYRGRLRDDLCPVVGGRRLIPIGYLEQIRLALKRAGREVRQAVANG